MTSVELDSEMSLALAAQQTAENQRQAALTQAIAAARKAAAAVTDEELARWTAAAQKLWDAQQQLAAHNGALNNPLRSDSSGIVKAQARHSWLGTLIGISVPIFYFGADLLDHSFLIPCYWMLAVTADVAGRSVCLNRADLVDPDQTVDPSVAAALAGEAIKGARADGNWNKAITEAQELARVDSAVQNGDAALRRGRDFGRSFGLIALGAAAVGVIGSANHVAPGDLIAWLSLAAALVFVFGVAGWLTSLSYAGAVEQPPYPAHGSATRFKRHVQYESLLANVPSTSFTNHDTVARHTTKQMRKRRVLHRALHMLSRSDSDLQEAQWQLAILKAERR